MTPTTAQVRKALAPLCRRSAMFVHCSSVAYLAATPAKTEDGIVTLPSTNMWVGMAAMERAGLRFTAEGVELRVKA